MDSFFSFFLSISDLWESEYLIILMEKKKKKGLLLSSQGEKDKKIAGGITYPIAITSEETVARSMAFQKVSLKIQSIWMVYMLI